MEKTIICKDMIQFDNCNNTDQKIFEWYATTHHLIYFLLVRELLTGSNFSYLHTREINEELDEQFLEQEK